MKRLLVPLLVVVGVTVAACGSSDGPTTGGGTTSSAPSSTATTVPSSTPSTRGGVNPPVGQTVHVWFLDRNHAQTGQEPLFRSVERTVSPPAPAGGALDALFAGPTATEQADGLELVLSGATGYTGLHIADGIASVTLQGGCSSGGSTMTIAGEIVPTLEQFSSVQYVKIFAPDGTTEDPTGAADSIPTCLEP